MREAEQLRSRGQPRGGAHVEEGKRELEVLMRRREDINAEISRVQDVLEALESFEAPSARQGRRRQGGRPRSAPHEQVSAAGSGTRSESGKPSEGL